MKRGQSSTLGHLVIVLIVMIGITSITYAALQKFHNSSERELCHTTEMARTNTQWSKALLGGTIPLGTIRVFVSSECNTHYVTFYNKKVTERVKDEKAIMKVYNPRTGKKDKSFHSLTPSIVNGVIADQMYWCWWQFTFANGSIPPFFHVAQDWTDRHIQCFKCSQISFDTSVIYEPGEEDKLIHYLKNTAPTGGKTTYYELFESANGPCPLQEDESLSCYDDFLKRQGMRQDINITSHDSYVVLYVREGYQKPKFTTGMYVVPDGDVSRICKGGSSIVT